jgi:hypothetical protein
MVIIMVKIVSNKLVTSEGIVNDVFVVHVGKAELGVVRNSATGEIITCKFLSKNNITAEEMEELCQIELFYGYEPSVTPDGIKFKMNSSRAYRQFRIGDKVEANGKQYIVYCGQAAHGVQAAIVIDDKRMVRFLANEMKLISRNVDLLQRKHFDSTTLAQ